MPFQGDFSDVRVRKAIALMWNLEHINYILSHRSEISPLKVTYTKGEFSEAVSKILPENQQNFSDVRENGYDPSGAFQRRPARQAIGLLAEAGYTIGDDGLLRNSSGQILSVRIVSDYPVSLPNGLSEDKNREVDFAISVLKENLQKIGVRVSDDSDAFPNYLRIMIYTYGADVRAMAKGNRISYRMVLESCFLGCVYDRWNGREYVKVDSFMESELGTSIYEEISQVEALVANGVLTEREGVILTEAFLYSNYLYLPFR